MSVKNKNSKISEKPEKSEESLKKTVKDELYVSNLYANYDNYDNNNKSKSNNDIINIDENNDDLNYFGKNYSENEDDNKVNYMIGVKDVDDFLCRKSNAKTLNTKYSHNNEQSNNINEKFSNLVIFPESDNQYFKYNDDSVN